MSQHFLLSAAARTLSVAKVARLSGEEALDVFKQIRWAATNGEPSTNMAESFFSRLRRADGEQYLMTASAALAHPVSRQWKGYWQRVNVSR